MEREEQKLSAQLGRIHHIIMRNIEARLCPILDEPITPPQVRTILFISNREANQVTCQRDIEEAFDLKPSSVSLLLRNMEKSGLIFRQGVEGDGRLKSVCLTPKAGELSHLLREGFDQIEDSIANGITAEEKKVFFTVLQKIRKNLE